MEKEKTRWDVLFDVYKALPLGPLRARVSQAFTDARANNNEAADALEHALVKCGAMPRPVPRSTMDEGAQEYEDYMAAQAALEALQEG